MKELVEIIARSLVDHQMKFPVSRKEDEKALF